MGGATVATSRAHIWRAFRSTSPASGRPSERSISWCRDSGSSNGNRSPACPGIPAASRREIIDSSSFLVQPASAIVHSSSRMASPGSSDSAITGQPSACAVPTTSVFGIESNPKESTVVRAFSRWLHASPSIWSRPIKSGRSSAISRARLVIL